MNKLELSHYLCNLHTLLDAQSRDAHSIPSTVLAAEYEKHWGLLKEAINKETEDEDKQRVRTETRTDHSRNRPRRSV